MRRGWERVCGRRGACRLRDGERGGRRALLRSEGGHNGGESPEGERIAEGKSIVATAKLAAVAHEADPRRGPAGLAAQRGLHFAHRHRRARAEVDTERREPAERLHGKHFA